MNDEADLAGRRHRSAALGEAMRAAARAVVDSDAPDVDLDAARQLAERITALLSPSSRSRTQLPAVDDLTEGVRMFSPISGLASPVSPPASLTTTPSGVEGTVELDRRFEGPPGHVHGGMISMLLDEVLGQAVTRHGRWGLTARLSVEYRRAVPLYTPIRLVGRFVSIDGRKCILEGGLYDADDPQRAYATGEALFIEPRAETQAEYFGALTDASGAATSPRLGGTTGWGLA